MKPEPFNSAERELIDKTAKFVKPELNDCWRNAQQMATRDSRFKYCEGFWTSPGTLAIPIEHAWNTLNGKVVDVTAEKIESVYTTPANAHHYFGIEIPLVDVWKHQVASEHYGRVTGGKYWKKFVNKYIKDAK